MAQTCPHTSVFKFNNIKLVVYCCYLPLLGDGIRQSYDVSQLCVPMSFGGHSMHGVFSTISVFLRNTHTTVRTYVRTHVRTKPSVLLLYCSKTQRDRKKEKPLSEINVSNFWIRCDVTGYKSYQDSLNLNLFGSSKLIPV